MVVQQVLKKSKHNYYDWHHIDTDIRQVMSNKKKMIFYSLIQQEFKYVYRVSVSWSPKAEP